MQQSMRPLPVHARALFCLGTSLSLLSAAAVVSDSSSHSSNNSAGVGGRGRGGRNGSGNGGSSGNGSGTGAGAGAGTGAATGAALRDTAGGMASAAAEQLLVGVDSGSVLQPMRAGPFFAVETGPGRLVDC